MSVLPTPTSLRRGLATYLRHYHRHEVHLDSPIPDEPVLFVCNHGFGGVVDLNALALLHTVHRHVPSRPVIFLVHQVAWTLRVGRAIEALGGRPASRSVVQAAYEAGHHVAVFPGGDLDAAKPWGRRNSIHFSGRIGFATVALEHRVPIVPIVTAGAGESLLVLSDGVWLASLLGLPGRLRVKSLPVSLSLPWGLNVGVVGMLPYLPVPTKLRTAVLTAVHPAPGEDAADLAARVEAAMADRLAQLVAHRTPILG